VYEGEGPNSLDENYKVAQLSVEGLPANKKGFVGIELLYQVDSDR